MHPTGSPTIPPNRPPRSPGRWSLVPCTPQHYLPSIQKPRRVSFKDDDTILPLPPSARTQPTHYQPDPPTPLDDFYSSPASSHPWPLPNALLDRCKLPPLSSWDHSLPTSPMRPPSPMKSLEGSSMYSQDDSRRGSETANPLFADGFNDAAQVTIGFPSSIPPPKDDQEIMQTVPPSRPPLRNSSSRSTSSKHVSWSSPRSQHARQPSGTQPRSSTLSPCKNPLVFLDINTLLFPRGQPDPSSPNAYQDLLNNAQAVVQGLQATCRNERDVVQDTTVARSVHDEEVEEAKTRARHLKLQLDDMAARAVQQDQAMREMAEELRMERERAERERQAQKANGLGVRVSVIGEEDMEAAARIETKDFAYQRHQRHESDVSFASDSGFESSCDDTARSSSPASHRSSVFSHAPHSSISSVSTAPTSPALTNFSSSPRCDDPESDRIPALAQRRNTAMPRPLLLPKRVESRRVGSTSSVERVRVGSFGSKRVISGAAAESKRPGTSPAAVVEEEQQQEGERPCYTRASASASTVVGAGASGADTPTYDRPFLKGMMRYPWEVPGDEKRRSCANCGVVADQASAWAAVRTFREQNERLKGRVGELEETVESVLELIGAFE